MYLLHIYAAKLLIRNAKFCLLIQALIYSTDAMTNQYPFLQFMYKSDK